MAKLNISLVLFQSAHMDLWEKAANLTYQLTTLQNEWVNMMNGMITLLPSKVEDVNNVEKQTILLNYIRLYSFYRFAYKLWTLVDDKCREIVHSERNGASAYVDDLIIELERIMAVAKELPLAELAKDEKEGLLKLESLKEQIQERMDWGVFRENAATWSFLDIIETIKGEQTEREKLWEVTIKSIPPTGANIGKILEIKK